MTYNPIVIGDLKVGLQRNLEAFKISNEAFPELLNVFPWRSRLKRRRGYTLLGRLQRVLSAEALGSTGSTTFTVNIITYLIGTSVLQANETGATIVPGSVTISVGAPDTSSFTEPATPDGTLIGTGAGTTGTINYETGAIVLHFSAFTGASAVTIAFTYTPNLPVMGFTQTFDLTNNIYELLAWDQDYGYNYDIGTGAFEEWIPGTVWTGNDANFFWFTDYLEKIWITNFSGPTGDPMYYTDTSTYTSFAPTIAGSNKLQQAEILLAYQNRLIAFNTYEGTTLAGATNFPQRARWSTISDTGSDATDQTNGWRQDIPGRGNYLDAPTNEVIVGAAFIRDTLVVGFTNSMWLLRYTGNVNAPFIWERTNNDFGIEAQFSTVTFDDVVLAVGDRAIVSTNGLETLRIDNLIPDEVFNFHNANQGANRIHGIREYTQELVYWTFPNDDRDEIFPNRVLVYNYRDPGFAFFKDSFTCFGRWQRFADITWASLTSTWEESNFAWNSGLLQSKYPNVVAGNQQGFVLVLDQQTSNSASRFISAITFGAVTKITSPNHNFEDDDAILIMGIIGSYSALNGGPYIVSRIDANNFYLYTYNNSDGTLDPVPSTTSTYLGNGTITEVSNFSVKTKLFNLIEQGKNLLLGKADLLMDVTEDGEFTVDVFGGYNNALPLNLGPPYNPGTLAPSFNTTVATTSNGNLSDQTKEWHRFYCNSNQAFLQLALNLSFAEVTNLEIAYSDWILHGIILWVSTAGRLQS